MIDFRETTEDINEKLLEALRDFREKQGSKAELLFYHAHPQYGEVHIYLTTDINIAPDLVYDELVGTTIDYMFQKDAWYEEFRSSGRTGVTVGLQDGTIREGVLHEELNQLFGQFLYDITKDYLAAVESELLPSRVHIESESGEYIDSFEPGHA